MCRSAKTRSSISSSRATSRRSSTTISPSRSHAHGFGDAFFPLPEPLITGPATRVMSLRDGTKKMSKSDPSDYSRINLTDDADAIAQKIRKAKTDPEPLPSEEKGLERRPEADNLVGIYAALAGKPKPTCWGIWRRAVLGLQDIARRLQLPSLPDRRRDEAAGRTIRPISTMFWPTAPIAPARSPRKP